MSLVVTAWLGVVVGRLAVTAYRGRDRLWSAVTGAAMAGPAVFIGSADAEVGAFYIATAVTVLVLLLIPERSGHRRNRDAGAHLVGQ